MPATLEELARLDRWLDFFQIRLGPPMARLAAPSQQPATPELADARRAAVSTLRILEQALEGRTQLLSGFSIFDCGAAPLVLGSGLLPLGELPGLAAYLQALAARPAWARVRARLAPPA